MTAYYNEIDPHAAQWLRNLIAAGHIAPGDVDQRSIEDVHPHDLRPYTQCHFFAGIGVWSAALRRIGWPDDRPIWTGSCPCQPFSAAGKGVGFADERHLWPAFFHLITQCGPAVVAGEQVASKDGLGWLDLVQADMEGTGYAFGAVDTCAAGVGAPHIRQRLYWLADAAHQRIDRGGYGRPGWGHEHSNGGAISRLGDDDDAGLEGQRRGYKTESGRIGAVRPVAEAGEFGGLADANSGQRYGFSDGQRRECDGPETGREQSHGELERFSTDGRMADPTGAGWCEQCADLPGGGKRSSPERLEQRSGGGGVLTAPGPTNQLWRDADWLFCRDGKWRPVEPGTLPLAHGAPARVGRLRAYGNAINLEQAAAFLAAALT